MPFTLKQFGLNSGGFNQIGDLSDWSFVEKYEFNGVDLSSNPYTFAGLEGDSFDYKLVSFLQGVNSNYLLKLLVNNATMITRELYGGGSSAGIQNQAASALNINWINDTGGLFPSFSETILRGSSGDYRIFDSQHASYYSNTSYTVKVNGIWTNTADEVTSFKITGSSATLMTGVVYLFRKPKVITNSANWDLIKSEDVSAQDMQTFPVDFDNLNGDKDEQYLVEFLGNAVSVNNLRLAFKGAGSYDTSNYQLQSINNQGFIAAAPSSSIGNVLFGLTTTDAHFSALVFTKSGSYRFSRSESANISSAIFQLDNSRWWKNDTDNLTGIRVYATASAAVTGTFKIYKRKRQATGVHEKLKYDVDFSGDFSSGQTFNIDGDKLYRVVVSELDGAGLDLNMTINGVTSYYTNYLRSNGVVSSSALNGSATEVLLSKSDADYAGYAELLLYPKNVGEYRPMTIKRGYESGGSWFHEYEAAWMQDDTNDVETLEIFASGSSAFSGNIKIYEIDLP